MSIYVFQRVTKKTQILHILTFCAICDTIKLRISVFLGGESMRPVHMKRSEILFVPSYCVDYIVNLQVVRGLSPLTVHEYYLDLRTFFRFLKSGALSQDAFDEVDASDYSLDRFKGVTLGKLYEFLAFLQSDQNVSARSRMRKISSIRGLYKHLMTQKLITENPALDLRLPKIEKRLPQYLSFQQSYELLNTIDGRFKSRNLAIITIFLNCGIRLSELVGLNLTSIKDREIRVIGKGNKERILFLNDACLMALREYTEERKKYTFKITEPEALFVSQKGNRISQRMVQTMVKDFMRRCGIDTDVYSVHKLRHTAATLMYQSGVDVRILQEILGHSNLGTTQIYTHISNSQIEKSMQSISISDKQAGPTGENQ